MHGIGSLTYDQARDLHDSGYGRAVIAARAGVSAGHVTKWRGAHGLSRRWQRFDIGSVDVRTYKREWRRKRGAFIGKDVA